MKELVYEFGSNDMGGDMALVFGTIKGQEGYILSAHIDRQIGEDEDKIVVSNFTVDINKLIFGEDLGEKEEKLKKARMIEVLTIFFRKLVNDLMFSGEKRIRMDIPMLPAMSEEICRLLKEGVTNADEVVLNFRSRIISFICV